MNRFVEWSTVSFLSGTAAAILLYQVVWFLILPALIASGYPTSTWLRRYLQSVVNSPSLLGGIFKLGARHELLRVALAEGYYDQAIREAAKILDLHVSPSLEPEIRSWLATAYEAMGRRDEAEEERQTARACLERSSTEPAWYLNRAERLESRRDFTEASDAYHCCLEKIGGSDNYLRQHILVLQSLAFSRAGKPEESANRAEEAADIAADPLQRRRAHRQAGAAYCDLGRLDLAERHKVAALELAREIGEPRMVADSIAELAEVTRLRGALSRSLLACDEAEAEGGLTRQVALVRYETLRSAGRFEQSLDSARQAARLAPLPIARYERFVQSMITHCVGRLLLDLGRIDEATEHLAAARRGFGRDLKMNLWCNSTEAILLARRGCRHEAFDLISRIDRQLAAFPTDRNTQTGALASMGRVFTILERPGHALNTWDRFLGLPLCPVDRPMGLYFRGECLVAMGHVVEARAAYELAAGMEVEGLYGRLARERLAGNEGGLPRPATDPTAA